MNLYKVNLTGNIIPTPHSDDITTKYYDHLAYNPNYIYVVADNVEQALDKAKKHNEKSLLNKTPIYVVSEVKLMDNKSKVIF